MFSFITSQIVHLIGMSLYGMCKHEKVRSGPSCLKLRQLKEVVGRFVMSYTTHRMGCGSFFAEKL